MAFRGTRRLGKYLSLLEWREVQPHENSSSPFHVYEDIRDLESHWCFAGETEHSLRWGEMWACGAIDIAQLRDKRLEI